MPRLHIRAVTLNDVPVLARLARETFAATFASDNKAEDLEAYMDRAFGAERLAAEIRTHGSAFFFAVVDDEPAGYLKLNTGAAQTEQVDGNTLEVERLYVAPAYQRAGLGRTLLDYACEQAKTLGCDGVWLGVWENNAKAIAFYKRLGFAAFGEHDFVVGTDVQTDILMRLPLN